MRTTSLLAPGLCEAASLGGLAWCVLPQSPRWNYALPKSARACPALSAVSRRTAGQGLHSTSVLRLGTSLSVGPGQTPILVLAPLLESLGLGNIYYIISWNFKNVLVSQERRHFWEKTEVVSISCISSLVVKISKTL